MSRFLCHYCNRSFAARVRRPPDCPTQDCCDIQEVAEPEELDPISAMLAEGTLAAPPAAAPAPRPARPTPVEPPARPVPPPAVAPIAPAPRPAAPAPVAPPIASEPMGLGPGALIGGYQITALESEAGAEAVFAGVHRVSGEHVRIRRYRPIGTQALSVRADVRKLIDLHGNAAFLRILHLEQVGGHAFEVLERPHGPSLREWSAGRACPPDHVRGIVDQLSGLIATLHAAQFNRALVHRGLSLDTVFLRSHADGTSSLEIGGWETAMVIASHAEVTCAIELPDLPTCPPEAVGRTTFCFDEQAKAWDWWSLGRIAQELALGRHVFELLPTGGVEATHLRQSVMLDEDTTRFSPKGVRFRPGLVEVMGGLDVPSRKLLRGLLACNPRARWGGPSVEAWLRGTPVDDPYDLSTAEPVFTWDGKTFTVSEAAKYLLTQANWNDALSNFIDSANPKRLSYQILHVYKARRYIDAYDSASKLLGEPALAPCSRDFREGLAASLFLSAVADFRDTAVFTGREMNAAWVLERLNAATTPEAIEAATREIAALLDPSVARRIDTQFTATGGLLRKALAIYQDARRPLERHREILDLRNARDHLVLLKLVFADPTWIAGEAEATRKQFHDAGVSPWKEIWAATEPLDLPAQILVLIARIDIAKARLRTYEQWANEQIDALRSEAARWFNYLVHAQAGRPMTWGLPTYGGPVAFTVILVATGAAWTYGLGYPLASPAWIVPIAGAVGLRVLGWVCASQYLSARLGTRVWPPLLNLGPHVLARAERLMVVVKGERQHLRDALNFVEHTNDEIRRLTPAGQTPRTFPTEPPLLLNIVALLHWALILVAAVVAWRR